MASGECQICGHAISPLSARQPVEWVPYDQVKDRQDLSFALSSLKIRGANGETRDVQVPLLVTPVRPRHDVHQAPHGSSGCRAEDELVGKWL